MANIWLSEHIRLTQLNDEGHTPSFFIRYRDPAAFLTSNWNYVHCENPLTEKILSAADVIVVQRASSIRCQFLIEDAKRAGTPVIYETDDFFLDLPPQSGLKLSNERKTAIRRMLSLADVITCSTPSLAAELATYNGNVRVLENYAIPFDAGMVKSARRAAPHLAIVNTDYFKLIEAKSALFRALRHALETLNYEITFFGTVDPHMVALQAAYPERVKVWSSFIPWRRAFIEHLMNFHVNVALVPLEDTVHHRVKSDIKYLDFSSIGVPGLYNNRNIYARVKHKATGFFCDNTYEGWLEGLTFFADETVRNRCGDEAHRQSYGRTLNTYAEEFATVVRELAS